MTARVRLTSRMAAEDLKTILGKRMPRGHLALVADGGDVDAYRPDGTVLFKVRRGFIPRELNDRATPVLREAATRYKSANRGSYTGYPRTVLQDGVSTRVAHTIDPETGKGRSFESAIVGFFDRQGGRFPLCRATMFTADDVARWAVAQELAQHVAPLLQREMPERWSAQAAHAEKCHPAWIIPRTPFSTLTVNRNVLGAVHKDSGDYAAGFGVITVHRSGHYRGAILGFPEFFIGADLRDGDAILFDPHAWHAVTDFEDKAEGAERISVVYYLRDRMIQCGSPEEELARGQARTT